VNKIIHVLWHTAAVICFSIGLYAVFTGNNYKDKNTEGFYFSNLNSLHSLLGLTAVILYSQNYLLGFISFLIPGVVLEWKQKYMPKHKFLGLFSLFAACFAALTGVMELTTEFGCGYDVDSADVNPAENYHLLTKGCQIANGIGIFVLLTAFLAGYTMINFEEKSKDEILLNVNNVDFK
jgi:hypothetical protein